MKKRISISLLELMSLPLLVATVLLSYEQLYFKQRAGHTYFLKTGAGLALLLPFVFLPFFCFVWLKYCPLKSVYTLSGVGFALLTGLLLGVAFGQLMSIPAYFSNLADAQVEVDRFAAGSTYLDPMYFTGEPAPPSSELKLAAFVYVPSKTGLHGAMIMAVLIVLKTRSIRSGDRPETDAQTAC